ADRQTEDLGLLLALFARSPAAVFPDGIAQMPADKTKMTHLHLGFDGVELDGRSRRGVAIRDQLLQQKAHADQAFIGEMFVIDVASLSGLAIHCYPPCSRRSETTHSTNERTKKAA